MPFNEALAHCRERGYSIENSIQRAYYRGVRRANLLTDTPLVLVDWGSTPRILVMNDPAEALARGDGLSDIQTFREYVDSWIETERERLDSAAKYAASSGKEGEILVQISEKERILHYKMLSRMDGHILFAVQIDDHTGWYEKLTRKTRTMMNILNVYRGIFSIDTEKLTIRNLRFSEEPESDSGEELLSKDSGELPEMMPRIFPADEKRFSAFLEPSTLRKRLLDAPDGILRGVFRTREENGKYQWMSHQLLFAADSGHKEILYIIRATDDDTALEESNIRNGAPYRALTMTGKEEDKKGLLWDDMMMNIPIPLFWKDKNRRFLGASRSFLDYFGFDDASAILGKTDEEMEWHPNNEAYRNDENEVLRTGRMRIFSPGRCISRGKTHTIYATKWPTYQNGEISGLMGFFIDEKRFRQIISGGVETAHGCADVRIRNAAQFMQDLTDYDSDYLLNKRKFGIIFLEIPALVRISENFGHEATNRVISACENAIAEAAGLHPRRGHGEKVYRQFFWLFLCEGRKDLPRKLSCGSRICHRKGADDEDVYALQRRKEPSDPQHIDSAA